MQFNTPCLPGWDWLALVNFSLLQLLPLLLWVSPSLLELSTLGEDRRKGGKCLWLHWCCCCPHWLSNIKALGSGLFKDSLSHMGSMCGFFRKLWRGQPVPWCRQAIHCDLIQSTFTWRYILQPLAEAWFPSLCLSGPWENHYPLSTTQWRWGFPRAQPSHPYSCSFHICSQMGTWGD